MAQVQTPHHLLFSHIVFGVRESPMQLPELLIIRHGQTEWNRAGLMQGHLDSPLTTLGQRQARDVATLLETVGLDPDHQAWVSPLGRAQATAKLALAGHFEDWKTDARLAEICVGPAQGMAYEDMVAEFSHLAKIKGRFGWQFDVPGGETYAEFSGRIAEWLMALDAPAVVVTHGVTSAVMRALALDVPRDNLDDLPGGQGVIHRVKNGCADMIGPLA
jgi:broad specificity phosphatase PhoE